MDIGCSWFITQGQEHITLAIVVFGQSLDLMSSSSLHNLCRWRYNAPRLFLGASVRSSVTKFANAIF